MTNNQNLSLSRQFELEGHSKMDEIDQHLLTQNNK